MTNNERLTMTISELSKTMCISRNLCYKLAKMDELPVPVIRLGQKRMCVSRRAIEALLSATKNGNVTS